ncbi:MULTISPECIES: hypothetical protein [unclassified Clostridium]|uniref:hypothetical protein n=1 Tax=unclassified Clostridium TaxID=2614128 RepID=UPI00023AFDE9|nr:MULTISPECIES: hypothetical protein [unclassified Clostridium]EHI98996.1 hypothetical protein CDLVIII_2340 [Clostridium sp. DL-VIII]OOM73884.1 hypothetical protein CLOBL_45490 [Clostridium sp. BL-8]
MTFLDNLSPEDLLVLTNAIAVSLSKNKTADEINVIGNFIVGIGCLMLTIASQEQYLTILQEQYKQKNNANNKTTPEDDTIIG